MKLKFNKIVETCLYVKDLDQTRNFYEGKLGLDVIHFDNTNHVFFRAGQSVLLCFLASSTKNQKNLPPHYGNGNLHFAFEVKRKDYEEWKNKVLQEKIEIEHEAEWKDLKSFYFRDPDDNLAEIIMEGAWGS